jgi:tRNA(Ile)-lysidine synthase TilS/MesJ
MTDPGMKCTRCKGPARHRFRQYNARFCDPCLEVFFQGQVARAIEKYRMLEPGQRVLVAVSGGKDSLALWQVLCDLGYAAEGVHLSLDLGEFSEASLAACQAMAQRVGRPLHLADLEQMAGHKVQEVVWANKRQFCAVCGGLKRHFLNRLGRKLGVTALASGHHLDDEAGRLLGNMIHQHGDHLERQWPVLEGSPEGFVRKVKPLCRLGAEEIRAYALAHQLPVAAGKCPMSKGATLLYYQEAMDYLDEKMPGTKRNFYLSFLRAKSGPPPAPVAGGSCQVCGEPTFVGTCTVCRMLGRTGEWKLAKQVREAQEAQEF